MAKFGANTPIAIGFEHVANRFHLCNDSRIVRACIAHIVVARASDPHQSASFCDGDTVGPAMTDVVALRGRAAFFTAPLKNSISTACRPTMRSNNAILASYSFNRSAAWVFVQAAGFILLNPDTDQLARQIISFGLPVTCLT